MTQYHFTSWPDHGVPKFATSIISFIRRVQKAHNKESGVPLLVHCSAGVGRTGTFILLDSMLERIKIEKTVNVYEFLCGLRRRRVLMVQTLVCSCLPLFLISFPFGKFTLIAEHLLTTVPVSRYSPNMCLCMLHYLTVCLNISISKTLSQYFCLTECPFDLFGTQSQTVFSQ